MTTAVKTDPWWDPAQLDQAERYGFPETQATLHDPQWCEANLKIRVKKGGPPAELTYNFVQQELEKILERLIGLGRPIRLLVLKARQMGVCLDPATGVLTAELQWLQIKDLKVGQEVVSVDEMPPGGKGHHRRMRRGVVEAVREVHDVAYRLTMENGRTLSATGRHRFLVKAIAGAVWRPVELSGRPGQHISVGDQIRCIPKPGKGGGRRGDGYRKVVHIERLDARTMIDLQTSTKTFIAEGFVSHNSTWVESVVYDWIRRRAYQNALIVANDSDGSEHLYRMFETFHEFDAGAPQTRFSHQKGLTFAAPHSSRVHVQTAGKTYAGTTLTIQLAHLSELSKWPDPETTALSIMQALADDPDTMAVMESTAAGAGDWWNREWDRVLADNTEWLAVFFPWFADPSYSRPADSVDMNRLGEHERYNLLPGEETDLLEMTEAHIGIDQHVPVNISMEQLAWRRWAIDNKCNGDVLLFHQEYPATPDEAFISAGTPKFNVAILTEMKRECTPPIVTGTFPTLESMGAPPPKLIEGEEVVLKIWKRPEPDAQYAIGADCKGSSPFGDRHAAAVFNRRTREVVATLVGMWDADTYASHLCQAARFYNNALVIIEINGVGEAVQNRARRIYHNFYHRLQKGGKEQQFPTEQIGWVTHGSTTRPELIETLAESIRERNFQVWDEEFVGELISFHAVPGQRLAEAKPGAKDDCVMSLGIVLVGSSYTALGEIRGYDAEKHEAASGENMGKFR